MPAPSGSGHQPAGFDRAIERDLRQEVRGAVNRLLEERGVEAPDSADEPFIRTLIHDRVTAYQRRAATVNAPLLSDPAGAEKRLADGFLGLGILQRFLESPQCEEIMCNGPQRIFIVENGEMRLVSDLYFDSDEELRELVKRLIGGKHLDDLSPMVDARLPDGSRLNAVIPPASTRWCCLTIRKFLIKAHSLEDLTRLGTISAGLAEFLEAAVQAGLNVLISGGTASGKTTLLNCLGSAIASSTERVLTVEETPELELEKQLPNCVALQARPPNIEGAGELRIRDLVRNALRMRPTRIVVGEVRGPEALDMLTAMNTGHEGSITTVHANSPRHALQQLTTWASMAEERLSIEALTHMVASTIELVIQIRREPRFGRRRVVSVFEVTGMERDVIAGQELWTLDRATDRIVWTGIRPRCLEKMAAQGVDYSPPPLVEAA